MAITPYVYKPEEGMSTMAHFLLGKEELRLKDKEINIDTAFKIEGNRRDETRLGMAQEKQTEDMQLARVKADQELRQLESTLLTQSIQQKESEIGLENKRLDNQLKGAQVELVRAKTGAMNKALGKVYTLENDTLDGIEGAPEVPATSIAVK